MRAMIRLARRTWRRGAGRRAVGLPVLGLGVAVAVVATLLAPRVGGTGAAPPPFELAALLESQGEFARALAGLQAGADSLPRYAGDEPEVLRAELRLQVRLGRDAEALALLERDAECLDVEAAALLRAALHLRRGDADLALVDLRQVTTADLQGYAALLAAEAHADRGTWQATGDAAARALAAPLPDEMLERGRVLRAVAALHQGDAETLRGLDPEVGAAVRRDDRTGLLLYEAVRAAGTGERADAWLLELLQARPTPAESAYAALCRLPRPRLEAREDATLQLARYEMRSGRHVEARNRLRRRIESAASAAARAEARLLIAESFQKQGEDARCLHELVRAAVDTRGTRFEPERLRLRARSQRRLGRRSDALETYRELARRFPSHPAADDALYEVGWIREGRRQFRSGERAYLACLRAYPRGTLADDALLRAGLCALRGGRAADASVHFAALVKRFPESSLLDNALYWRMVAQQRRGDAPGALALRDRLERDFPRSYYSVLARQRIERSLSGGASGAAQAAEPQPVPELDDGLARADRVHAIYTAAIAALRSLPELAPPARFEAEARLWRFLLDHGLAVEAGWEARRLERRFGSDPGALLELLAHSHRRGSTERLVRLAYRLSQQVDDAAVRPALEILSYPAPFTPTLAEAAARHGLSHAAVLGLVRQESAFDPRIDSAAGARGLMQLMPAVGARLARREGRLDHHVDDLYRPEVNVELGCLLLADELRLAHGDVPRALAAYNAGSGPAAAWRARLEPHEPAELYLDIAEYVETRTYLESVLGNREVYARVYALP